MIHIYWIPFYVLLVIIATFVLYYLFFSIVYLVFPERVVPSVEPRKKFMVVIPAHNEEQLLGSTLKHVLEVNYPRHLFQVAVIADNCGDRTAEIAAKFGVLVMERQDPTNQGKGFALSWALTSLASYEYDAIVIIDADTVMGREYLQEMNCALCEGGRVIQGYNNLLNAEDNALTRLIHVTTVMKNRLFNEGKARLGLSVPLMGTGMCFEGKVLEEMGWGAHSIGEDWEYFAKLTQRNIAVNYRARAVTYSQEASSFRQGFSQRLRWAGGKYDVMSRYGLESLWDGIRHADFWKVDAILGLLAPPFSQLAYLNALAVGLALIHPSGGGGQVARIVAGVLMGLQIGYFALGLVVMRASAKTVASVLISPIFLCWKLVVDVLAVAGYRRRDWVRTNRTI